MEEWKDPTIGPEYLMPSFLAEAFPLGGGAEGGSHGGKAGLEKHVSSAAASSPKEVKPLPLPMAPHFGQNSSLAERMQARAGFSVTKLSMPCIALAATDGAPSGAPSPYVTIPPGLSPATLLESPVFLSNAMGQASPTTGKLLMRGVTNDNGPVRFESPSIGDCPGAFSFKPLELKSSQYISEEKKESLSTKHHSSIPSTEVSVKTEANIQTAQEANLLGHLNQQQVNPQPPGGAHDSKLSRLQPGDVAGSDNASPPGHGQPLTEGDAKGDYPAVATAAAAAPAEDGYSWRKYGQKQVKHSEYPRSYYKCTHPNCQVKKKVERSHEGHITEIIYKGTHGHQKPTPPRRPAAAQMDAPTDNNSNSNNNAVEARPAWHNGVAGEDWRGDGVEGAAASSPSLPGELCDSAASMQVHDGAARFESPEGVDGASAVSDEVDGDDGVARGGMPQSAADAEVYELESKRRKLESCAIEMGAASRAVREPRVVIQTTSEVDILDDGYRWRKYGQKVVKGNPNPRSYYKCTHPGCMVRKHVERASHDLKSVITTYEGKHNHEVPAARNSGHSGAAAGSQPHAGGGGSSGRRPEPPLAQDGLMRLGGCGAPLAVAAFGLPPRDPLAPMSNYPYSLGHAAALPSLPMPSGLAAVEGLKLPSLHPLLRHRQAMETAGLLVPKGEAAMPGSAAGAGSGSAPSYQQMLLSRLPVRHQM